MDKLNSYKSQKDLIGKWNLLNKQQKHNAYELKKEYGWPIPVCIQQVLFFNNTVEKEKRWH